VFPKCFGVSQVFFARSPPHPASPPLFDLKPLCAYFSFTFLQKPNVFFPRILTLLFFSVRLSFFPDCAGHCISLSVVVPKVVLSVPPPPPFFSVFSLNVFSFSGVVCIFGSLILVSVSRFLCCGLLPHFCFLFFFGCFLWFPRPVDRLFADCVRVSWLFFAAFLFFRVSSVFLFLCVFFFSTFSLFSLFWASGGCLLISQCVLLVHVGSVVRIFICFFSIFPTAVFLVSPFLSPSPLCDCAAGNSITHFLILCGTFFLVLP